MNENVTIKTPKRRRWIARLLVSALCILLASSLLFVSVVAENTNAIVREAIDQSTSDSKRYFGYHFSSDGLMGVTECSVNPSNTQYIYIYKYGSIDPVATVNISISNISVFGGCSSSDTWIATWHYDGSVVVVNIWDYDGNRLDFDSFSVSGFVSFDGAYGWGYVGTVFYNGSDMLVNIIYKTSSDTLYLRYLGDTEFGFSFRYPIFNGEQWVFYTNKAYVQTDDFSVLAQENSVSTTLVTTLYCGNTIIVWLATGSKYIISFSNGYVQQLTSLPLTGRFGGVYLFDILLPNFSDDLVGFGIGSGPDSYYLMYVTSSEYVPPESSDETTTEPPPESSEESSAGGVIDLYSYDRLSDGTYESALIGTLDLTDATGLRVFLGMYLLGDNVWSDIKTPLTLLVYREDGSLDTYTYDYYAAGFAWGSGSPGSFTFPKFIGGYFDIPLSSSSELFFASSAPGGTIWLQNNSVVLRQINLLNSDSYVELENVSAEECIISVYDSPSDDDPESYVYTSGVLKYTLRKRNSSSSIPVSLDYGEMGIVHGVMKYNGADFTVSSIILASDPDLMPPIYDFESMDNALSEAYDDVSRQQYLENLLTSYIENAYGTVSYDPDTSGAFLGGVDLMGDIVDSSGGSTIISAFVNMWSIHPFFPAMVGLLGTFLIFSFFLRKA